MAISKLMQKVSAPPIPALLCMNGWAGYYEQPIEVIGQTPKRYRIRATERIRLGGRCRWLYRGETALVPKSAVKFASVEAA